MNNYELDSRVSIWVFDDLWEEGYRFQDILSNRYVVISRDSAKTVQQARTFLQEHYRQVKKIKGTSSNYGITAEEFYNVLVMVEEKL